jgi:hypothetical protein
VVLPQPSAAPAHSASGLLNSVLGEMQAFAVTLTAGIIVLFAGFLVASGAPRTPLAGVEPVGQRDAGVTRLEGRATG